MSAPYFVILDNTLFDEPLSPGLPYWTFSLAALPAPQSASRFVDDVLYQSELWANAATTAAEWVSLRLLQRRRMCSRCGHLVMRMGLDRDDMIHVVWFIARNPQPEIMGHEAALNLGLWHAEYREHQCRENFFAPPPGVPDAAADR